MGLVVSSRETSPGCYRVVLLPNCYLLLEGLNECAVGEINDCLWEVNVTHQEDDNG